MWSSCECVFTMPTTPGERAGEIEAGNAVVGCYLEHSPYPVFHRRGRGERGATSKAQTPNSKFPATSVRWLKNAHLGAPAEGARRARRPEQFSPFVERST